MYTAEIPAGPEGSEMTYYITAVDAQGNLGNHPLIGAPDPHRFFVGEQLFATISIDVTELEITTAQGNSSLETFELSNIGQLELNYSIEFSSAILVPYSYTIEDSPAYNAWNSNTYSELGWTEFEVDDAVGEIADWSISFNWDTDQYSDESSFYVLSPEGTEAIIAAALPDGTYTISLDVFNGEQMQGDWQVWITDSYGDGGHQATDIEVTITKTYTIFPWLSVNPLMGSIAPGDFNTLEVTADASVMPVGDYEGSIWVNSNDPDYSTVEIPVHFTVDVESAISNPAINTTFSISNAPNPFHSFTLSS